MPCGAFLKRFMMDRLTPLISSLNRSSWKTCRQLKMAALRSYSVAVTAGDEVANVEGDLVALARGVKVFPDGCTSLDCAVEWDGSL